MKKSLLVAAVLLALVAGANAQNYNYSVGGTIGSMYGASFKGFFLPIEKLGLQVDLGVNLFQTQGSMRYKGSASDTYETTGLFTFEVNPNLVYQDEIATWGFGDLAWYAGGGTSFGFLSNIEDPDVAGCNFKWGLNAVGGVELCLASVPLAFSFDFRPGYGLSAYGDNVVFNFFDWKLVAGIRYIF